MKAWKKIVSFALAAALALSLAACGSRKEETAQEGFAPSLDKETDGVIHVAGHYSNFEALEEEFNRFAEYYPNVKMSYTLADNYNSVLPALLNGNDAPDIFFTFPWMMGSDEYRSVFEAAEDLTGVTPEIDLSCIREGLLQKDSLGHLSIVPIYTTTYGMLVNEAIFEKEKLSVPKTYDELVEVCSQLQEAGWDKPVMGFNQNSSLLYALYFPYFCSGILGNEEAVRALNELSPSAGEYMRPALELTSDFMSRGFVDLESCNQLENDYDAVIMRFFEGDVPIMLASGNTVSGTQKRESQSEAFSASPFSYSFHPVPSTGDGGFFFNTISLGFSVNKNSPNLELANEFMRFLVCPQEINRMAMAKRMVTPCREMELDKVYASFGDVSSDRVIYSYELGLADKPDVQVRKAGLQVTNGTMTVDEAVAAFGTFE